MTPDEAKQLKPGDWVLAEMQILEADDTYNIDGEIWLGQYVKPERIRSKIAPPLREFRVGDIVSMSKHPTSELSPRDMACIMYGMEYSTMELYLGEGLRHNAPLDDKEGRAVKRKFIKQLREMRERIFRCCFECEHCDIEAGYCCKPGEEPSELTWQYEKACTCPHYARKEVGHA